MILSQMHQQQQQRQLFDYNTLSPPAPLPPLPLTPLLLDLQLLLLLLQVTQLIPLTVLWPLLPIITPVISNLPLKPNCFPNSPRPLSKQPRRRLHYWMTLILLTLMTNHPDSQVSTSTLNRIGHFEHS